MRKSLIQAAVTAAAVFAAFSLKPQSPHLEHFLPQNKMKIPVRKECAAGATFCAMDAQTGLTEDQFNQVLDVVEAIYGPIVHSRGGNLVINRLWDDPTVNSDARRQRSLLKHDWIIDSYGGLARFPNMTQDGYAAVACHEMGHQLGGAPKFSDSKSDAWASVEGEADYFANLKCLRRILADPAGQGFTRPPAADPTVQQACARSFSESGDQALCARIAAAGVSLAGVLASLDKQAVPSIGTPDPTVVAQTFEDHPAAQCRLDTYFQASLCAQPVSADLSDSDPAPGSCTLSQGFAVGMRPLCWFKPSQDELAPQNVTIAAAVEPTVSPASEALSTLQNAALWQGN